MGLRIVDFAHGTVVALYGGVLLYLSGDAPSNLSTFCSKKEKALTNNRSVRSLTVYLSTQLTRTLKVVG
jgi:hypothetical protein